MYVWVITVHFYQALWYLTYMCNETSPICILGEGNSLVHKNARSGLPDGERPLALPCEWFCHELHSLHLTPPLPYDITGSNSMCYSHDFWDNSTSSWNDQPSVPMINPQWIKHKQHSLCTYILILNSLTFRFPEQSKRNLWLWLSQHIQSFPVVWRTSNIIFIP